MYMLRAMSSRPQVQLRFWNSMPFPKCKRLLSKSIVLLFELQHAGGDGSMLMPCWGGEGDGRGDVEEGRTGDGEGAGERNERHRKRGNT